MNIGKLTDTAVLYARDHKVPVTRRQCKVMATEVMRRIDSESSRLDELRIITPDAAHTLGHSDPTGDTAVRNVQRMIDHLSALS